MLVFLHIFPMLKGSIYVYHTEDSAGVEVYDCMYHQSTLYCRRPLQPIRLQRDNESGQCYSGGKNHSLRSLRLNNISVHTVLHTWRSTLDKAEEYARYLRHTNDSNEGDRSLCECMDPQSFGKNCEYVLPLGSSLTDVINAKFDDNSAQLMYVGEIVCYTTLECNFGLLCLDWRDICDGQQHCMSGIDEENCDKLEFNECEDDEYRCMNGMCIPDQYFLDGEYDCMDMSDEKEPFKHDKCGLQPASIDCDDRVCEPNEWPCGDGQCVRQRFYVPQTHGTATQCFNRRDKFFLCERVMKENLQTESNGRCSAFTANATHNVDQYCDHLIMCGTPDLTKQHCSCREKRSDCIELHRKHCSHSPLIGYPRGALLRPYIFTYYKVTHNPIFISAVTILNGTIKCRGRLAQFYRRSTGDTILWVMHTAERIACEEAEVSQVDFPGQGYDRFCHKDSSTFNNRSYRWLDVCNSSSQCISAYRIKDGFGNCIVDNDEPHQNELVTNSCSNVQRHRFRCSVGQASCLVASRLARLHGLCKNSIDELSRGIQILASTTQCRHSSKADCSLLRDLIHASSNHTWYNRSDAPHFHLKKVPFRSYCDTFQDSVLNEDENITMCQTSWLCLPEQWKCHTGQCIEYAWVLDGEWDCPDGSDEENILAVNFGPSHPNSKWLSNHSLIKILEEKYFKSDHPYKLICKIAVEYGCTGIDAFQPTAGGNHSECVVEYSQSDVFRYCARTFIGLGYPSECPLMNASMAGSFTFRKRCPSTESNTVDANDELDKNRLTSNPDVTCWDQTVETSSRCDSQSMANCDLGEDEFMCGQESVSDILYRREKQDAARREKKKVQVPVVPPEINSSRIVQRNSTDASSSTPPMTPIASNLSSLNTWCNRGVAVWTHHRSFVCFCPPQYHGDQCQRHTDRLTLFLHVNYTHSNYTTSTDLGIVNKFLVLLLFGEQVVSTREFHTRPSTELTTVQKSTIYLHYSRSAHHLTAKQERYFNRSDIVHEQPYSIRIEAYEMQPNLLSRRFAVWQYPIYFDYLPVHRLATVLRFIDRRQHDASDPCHHRPCGPHQDCYRVLNQKSKHVCLCQTDFTGPNCSQTDSHCANGYCSPSALCQPGYRGLTTGNEWPYCVCPLGYIGQRCELLPNKCSEHPCRNNGTCFQKSKPNEYICECTDEYYGTNCDEPRPFIQLHIEHNASLSAYPVVVQYMKIDFARLALDVADQRALARLPDHLHYFHDGQPVPEIVLLKRHHQHPPDIHLILFRMDEISVNSSTSITEHNRCKPVHALFRENESKVAIRSHITFPNLSLALSQHSP